MSDDDIRVISSSPASSISLIIIIFYKRFHHLLKNEKHQYDIIHNKALSAVASHWSIFGFPPKLNQQTGNSKRIMGFTSRRRCRKPFVYGPNSGTNHTKSHSCVILEMKTRTSTTMSISISTQQKIDEMVLNRKTLTTEQSTVIKDLTVR